MQDLVVVGKSAHKRDAVKLVEEWDLNAEASILGQCVVATVERAPLRCARAQRNFCAHGCTLCTIL